MTAFWRVQAIRAKMDVPWDTDIPKLEDELVSSSIESPADKIHPETAQKDRVYQGGLLVLRNSPQEDFALIKATM
jgi:hypothetical protein